MHAPHRRASQCSSGPPSSESEGSDSDYLPEFWEEVCLPDGKVIYVDHSTETTTWERPRGSGHRSRMFKLTDPDLAWTARLETPILADANPRDSKSTSGDSVRDVQNTLYDRGLIADLLRDGYVLGDASTDFSDSGSVPDFWEVYKGTDGRTYYIDHPAGNILRSL